MKRFSILILLIVTFCSACFKDKGNYDYNALADITVEGVPEAVEVLSYIDRITVSPKITSSLEGAITADNPNYTFRYRLGYKGMGYLGGVVDGQAVTWLDVTPAKGYNLDIPANYAPNTYICWLTITDKRNNTVTSKLFDIKVSSTTYEGWLVLCNQGAEERARLDMISLLSSTKISTIHDIAAGLPVLHHATQLGFHPMKSSGGEFISLHTKEGAYRLDISTMESGPTFEFNVNGFIGKQPEIMTSIFSFSITADPNWRTRYSFVISDAGNAYCQGHGEAGSMYGLPINTTSPGTPVQFKVAPYAGFTQVRPSNGTTALFYDKDNKRFVGFKSTLPNQLSAIPDPDPRLFSFTTGKEMVYMEGTRRSNGLVYAILQDNTGKRSVYGVNMSGNGFVQESYYENITAPGFEQASLFAFHSQFPIMFYAVGNKVYLYNLGTQTAQEMTNITAGEITCLKFNLFRNSLLTNLNKQTPEFLNQQFQLIIGSYDNAATNDNGGTVGFYEVNGTTNTISKLKEYTGFAKVKDVVYRER